MKKQSITVPVILMTGYAEIQSAVLAMKSGAADYIAKPLNPEELLNKINESLVSNVESAAKQIPSSSLPEPISRGRVRRLVCFMSMCDWWHQQICRYW